MADTRISDLTAATALADADLVPIVQAGETKKLTGADLKTYTSSDRALAATTISAGTGLTGGGDLSANRTLALATGAAAANLGYTPEDVANKDAVGGYAGLDGSGKISTSALPDLAVSEYLGAIANETNMLALTGQKGDWVNRTDLGTVFIITGSTPSNLSSWTQLNYPTAPVTSVDGQTGAVDLSSVYEPADSSILKDADIGVTVQAYDSDLTAFAAKTAPTGAVVGTTDSQTLTNKTLTGYAETVYSLSGTEIDPANGTIQYKTLSANTTFTESLADGQSVTLMLNPGTYTATWPTTTWVGSTASTAPTLTASVYNCITFFQFGGTLYGKYEGRV